MALLEEVFLILCLSYVCCGQEFSIPKVILEAYEPSGLRASIPAESGIQMFAFHSKINQPLGLNEFGDYTGDITKSANGFFTFENPNLKLTVGDVVHYWVFVQHNGLGYRRDGQNWTVAELKTERNVNCVPSEMRISNRSTVCTGTVVLEDNFDLETLDETKWTLEKYIPTEPDYPFVIYKKDTDVTFIKNNKLCIKPKLITNEEQLTQDLDLSDGCTKPRGSQNCLGKLYLLQNPVDSGRVTSKIEFTYGKFEIRARLPSGDWIIPQIYLEDDNFRRILIAYSRGNTELTGNDGNDIGSRLLFGGPISTHIEPQRSSKLSSYKHTGPLNADVHTYTLVWRPNKIELLLDGTKYGSINTETGFTGQNAGKFRLVLGVGVGGVADFPDGFKSGTNTKPWKNRSRMQVKEFFGNRGTWYSTWSESDRQLRIEYVKVTAI